MARTKQVNLRIPEDVIDKYQSMADSAEDRGRSYFMKKAILSYVEAVPAKKPKQEKKEGRRPADEVIDHLNRVAGTQYKKTKTNRDLIGSRLKDFTVGDCVTVIDKKCREWLGTDMAKYLRPATLFQASKFESYLNQLEGFGNATDRPQSLAERSAEQTRIIQAGLASGSVDQCFMGSNGATVPSSMGQAGGGEAYSSEPIDGEFSVLVQENGSLNR